MPILQVRDLPDEMYEQLCHLAQKERRSLAQEAIVLIKEGITVKLGNQEKRRSLLKEDNPLDIEMKDLPDPVALIREDRER